MSLLSSETSMAVATTLDLLGKLVTFRHTLTTGGANPALNPVQGAIAVGIAGNLGDATVTLSAPLGNWCLAVGDTFQIAGDVTVYVITSPNVSAAGKFTAVSISPALVHAAALNAVCTPTWSNDYSVLAVVSAYPAALINGVTITVRDLRVTTKLVDTSGRALPVPTPLDFLLIDGVKRTVVSVNSDYVVSSPVVYEIQAR